ncbi:HU family DNA-binding protein [Vineibacter terrae]|uniref:HU family DNA-binding protein n=1 Tax=Vineibacter terrae TaxID=2586908 RepID=A0A5C8PQ40_9HYPH|nr:HU family DNA-binding protein [Vineibacter terrae]TXL76682.1 HU family DNA-binding protein [Vineibacter terrae]HEX2888094.1 HU family DNA-binding protein [Vineibacter terrae]
MNKNDLVAAVATQTNLSKAGAADAVDAVFSSIIKALKKKDKVLIVGFGTFYATKRKGGVGRNPRTGEPIKIAPAVQPKFKAGRGLKDALN